MVRAGPAAVVGAGPAVVGGGVVSGGWAEEDAAWARWWVARGDPVLGAWAVGAVALEKAWLGSPPSPGPGDASTCPAAPPERWPVGEWWVQGSAGSTRRSTGGSFSAQSHV